MISKFFTFFFVFCSALAFSQHEDDILGKWMATDKSVAVLVYKTNNVYRSKVLWFNEKLGSGKPMNLRHDTENPDPNLRSRKILGMEVLSGLVYNDHKKIWEKGKIYDASSGRTWDAYCEFEKNDLLKVRGYWKYTWIGRTMYFTRMK